MTNTEKRLIACEAFMIAYGTIQDQETRETIMEILFNDYTKKYPQTANSFFSKEELEQVYEDFKNV